LSLLREGVTVIDSDARISYFFFPFAWALAKTSFTLNLTILRTKS
jgi:hypothetical protein